MNLILFMKTWNVLPLSGWFFALIELGTNIWWRINIVPQDQTTSLSTRACNPRKNTPLYFSLSLPNASEAFSSLMAWQFKSVNNRIKNKKCHSTSVIIIVTSFHPPFAWKNSPFKREKIRHLSVKKFPGCSKPGMSNGPRCHLKYLNGPQNLLN